MTTPLHLARSVPGKEHLRISNTRACLAHPTLDGSASSRRSAQQLFPYSNLQARWRSDSMLAQPLALSSRQCAHPFVPGAIAGR